ncbi:hypothetical protein KIN20_010390, partial [Parelaphostrongylus tenuis]
VSEPLSWIGPPSAVAEQRSHSPIGHFIVVVSGDARLFSYWRDYRSHNRTIRMNKRRPFVTIQGPSGVFLMYAIM